MKFFVAVIGGLVIFVGAGFIALLVASLFCPKSWWETYVNLGFITANIPSLIVLVIATLAGTNSFWASLRVKNKKKDS